MLNFKKEKFKGNALSTSCSKCLTLVKILIVIAVIGILTAVVALGIIAWVATFKSQINCSRIN
ncbi:MAG: hypothetical protein LUQ70_02665 [Methanobacteriaceae archaeon]|nr:hypothetical protein [Methanobacteriaceae archaeon]